MAHREPDINTFHGWCRKMQEVGAQHLICVSVRGYPQSIIDEVATRYGPTVRLLTLDQLTEARIPIFDFILPYMFHQKALIKSLNVTQLGAKRPMESAEQVEPEAVALTFTERIFSVPDSEARLSIIDIGKQVLDRNLDAIIRDNEIVDFNNFTVDLNLAPHFPKLWIHLDDRKIQILDLVINLGIQLRVTRIPVTFYEYTQQFVEDTLSWVAVAKASINEVETDVRMVFKKNAEGYLEYQAQLLNGGNTLSLDFSVSPALNNAYYRFSEPFSS